MNTLDVFVLLVFLASAFISFIRGGLFEFLNVIGWVLGFMVAIHYSETLANHFLLVIESVELRMGAAFVMTFIVILFLCNGIAIALRQLIHKVGFSAFDRFIGVLMGVLKAYFVLMVAAVIAINTSLPETRVWKEASSVPLILFGVDQIKPYLPELLQRYTPIFKLTTSAMSTPIKDKTDKALLAANLPTIQKT